MEPQRPNPERRSARSQAAILEAAYELCQEQGYGRLTVEAIAARAGVGKQTIYRWWSSKGAVLLDVFVELIVGRLDVEDSGDPLVDMRRRVVATADVLADDAIGPHVAGLIGDAQHDPALAKEVARRLVVPARAQHRQLLETAQRTGELRDDLDLDVMADALFAPIWFRLLVTKTTPSPRYADEVVDAVMSDWTSGDSGERSDRSPSRQRRKGSARGAQPREAEATGKERSTSADR